VTQLSQFSLDGDSFALGLTARFPETIDLARATRRHDAGTGGQAMAWFESADGRVRFRGRITREPIREWLATEAGAAAVDEAARHRRFSLLGRRRAARQQLTRALGDAISGSRVRETVAAECEGYLAAWTPLAYAPSLPRLSIAYRRLVVVPRVMILWRVASRSAARVAASLPDAGVPDSFRTFFSQWVVAGVDQAVRSATPSPHGPLHALESWTCVAFDGDTIWVDTSRSGREWQGHVVMFEMPSPRLPRRERQELVAAIARLTESLPNLTWAQRDKTVRAAMDQLSAVRA